MESTAPAPLSRRLLRMSVRDWWVLGEAFALVPIILIAQQRMSMPALMRFFDARAVRHPRPRDLDQVVWIVDGVMRRLLKRDYCMKRSLILFRLLRRWGHDVRVIFGVRKHAGDLKGHAWVEIEGTPFREKDDPRERFHVTYAYPGDEPGKKVRGESIG